MTDASTPRAYCPACGCPDQVSGLPCGWCHAAVPMPAGAVGEVIGYRGWRVVDGKLRSPVYDRVEWLPGQWITAKCYGHLRTTPATGARRTYWTRGDRSNHTADAADPKNVPPVLNCGFPGHGCGFYAGKTHDQVIALGYASYGSWRTHRQARVTGRVQMAGKIIPATAGWRAQHVRVRELFVPYELRELCATLKDAYEPHGVPVTLTPTIIAAKEEAK